LGLPLFLKGRYQGIDSLYRGYKRVVWFNTPELASLPRGGSLNDFVIKVSYETLKYVGGDINTAKEFLNE
jgi:hypothetical protein